MYGTKYTKERLEYLGIKVSIDYNKDTLRPILIIEGNDGCFVRYPTDMINIHIEYDGTHHYEIKRTHGGFERLVQQKQNDRIKTKYCSDNNIKLYRIKYTDNLKDSIQDIFDYIKYNFK